MMTSPEKQQRSVFPPNVTESPEMKFARNRLGSLLQGIRRNNDDSKEESRDDETMDDDPFEFDEDGRSRRRSAKRRILSPQIKTEPGLKLPQLGGHSNRRSKKGDKRILFELRGKPFELNDQLGEQNIFQLCRVWMKGRDLPLPKGETDPYPIPNEDSLDLLATKEIYALPKPRGKTKSGPLWPEPLIMTHTPENLGLQEKKELLDSYLPHWKQVKKRWVHHTKTKETPYDKSLCLLETVYNIAQQNQLMH